MITVTKEFSFDAAHMLANHSGLCQNIHGHTYKVHVTLTGDLVAEVDHTDEGMLLDFKDLKETLNKHLFAHLDHAFIFNTNSGSKKESFVVDAMRTVDLKLYAMDCRPTAENMARRFSGIISRLIPKNCKLLKVTVWETPTSYAEYTTSGGDYGL